MFKKKKSGLTGLLGFFRGIPAKNAYRNIEFIFKLDKVLTYICLQHSFFNYKVRKYLMPH